MGNIMINDVCDQKCPYCFANEYVNGDTSTDITYANFKKAVDWINYSGEKQGEPIRVALIGGEPLLHHDLESLIRYADRERRPGQELLVFTNAYHLDEYADLFSECDVACLVNLNSPRDIGERRYNKIVDNIGLALSKQCKISLGINYYDPDMDMTFVKSVIEKYKFKNLRLGIVCPNTAEKRKEGPFGYLESIKEPLLQFVNEVAELHCGVHTDCQKFPSCVMSDASDRIKEIAEKNRVDIQLCEHARCHPVIDILTDLKIVRCFGVSDRKYAVPMNMFETEADAMGYFATAIDNLGMMLPMGDRCNECYHKLIGKCQGGCIGFKLDKIDAHSKPATEA